MCEYSLEHVKSRPAYVGDKLTKPIISIVHPVAPHRKRERRVFVTVSAAACPFTAKLRACSCGRCERMCLFIRRPRSSAKSTRTASCPITMR